MIARSMPGHLIRRLNQRSTRTFAAHMQTAGIALTPVQFAALDAIATFPRIDQAGVATKISYDRATIGGVIDRLVQKGLVERKVSPNDRRARVLELSAAGETMLKNVIPVVEAVQIDILAGLNADERQQFLALASKALDIDRSPE